MWTVVKLSDVATLSSGGTPSKANAAFWDGDIPWVSPKDMKCDHVRDAADKITRAAVSESAARIVGSNSVLAVVRSGILAHTFPVATLAREVSFNQDIKAITPKNGSLLPAFLFWMLKGQEAQILRIGVKKGATVHSLSNGFLESLRFPLPPLDEQRRIVGLLDRAAEIRRRADAARAKARAIIPALFLDTFGDPATDWPEITIGDILAKQANAMRTGPFGSQLKHSEFTDEGVPVLGIDNVVDNEFKWTKPRHLPREKYEAFKRFRVFPGDVIVTIMGTTGRVAVAPDNLPECMNTKHLCAFTLDRSLSHPRFVQGALLFDPGVRAQARGKANGQIMEGWNMGIVRSMRLRLPPLSLQTVFAEQTHRLESLARHLDAAAAKAEAMAAGLSAEVFG
jgi:type I restriction enzyme S subunit